MTVKEKEQNFKPGIWEQIPLNEDVFSRGEKLTTKVKRLMGAPGETS